MALSLADLRVTWDGKRVLNSIGLAYQVTDDLDDSRRDQSATSNVSAFGLIAFQVIALKYLLAKTSRDEPSDDSSKLQYSKELGKEWLRGMQECDGLACAKIGGASDGIQADIVKVSETMTKDKWNLLCNLCKVTPGVRTDLTNFISEINEFTQAREAPGTPVENAPARLLGKMNEVVCFSSGRKLKDILAEIGDELNEISGPLQDDNRRVVDRLRDIYVQMENPAEPLLVTIVDDFVELVQGYCIQVSRRLENCDFSAHDVMMSSVALTVADRNESMHHLLDELIRNSGCLNGDNPVHEWQEHSRMQARQGYQKMMDTVPEDEDASFATSGDKHSDSPRWLLPTDEVRIRERIAHGSFGAAYWGKWLGADVVVKKVLTNQDEHRNRQQFRREVELWFSLNHANVIKLYGACHEINKQPVFVCEQAIHGTLPSFLKGKSAEEIWGALYTAAEGLRHLHEQGIVHGDLKGNNVLVCDNNYVKLADFGLSAFAKSVLTKVEKPESIGAIRWRAPECIQGFKPTFASDIYSFGMCIVEVVTGEFPWGKMPDPTVMYQVVNKKSLPPRLEAFNSDERRLVKGMCRYDPKDRIDIGAVVCLLYQLYSGMGSLGVSAEQDADYTDEAILERFMAMRRRETLPNSVEEVSEWFIHAYHVEQASHIRNGGFGSVRWAGADVALQRIHFDKKNIVTILEEFRRQLQLWSVLDHPNIIQLYGAYHVENPFYVCERTVNGTLTEYLKWKDQALPWRCLLDAALGLQYLHTCGVVHGNLKGNGLLVSDSGKTKVGSFELTAFVGSDDIYEEADTAIRWRAPEVLDGGNPTFAADIYSFGMCVIEALTGEYPWGAENDIAITFQVKRGELPPRPAQMNDWDFATGGQVYKYTTWLWGIDGSPTLKTNYTSFLEDATLEDAWRFVLPWPTTAFPTQNLLHPVGRGGGARDKNSEVQPSRGTQAALRRGSSGEESCHKTETLDAERRVGQRVHRLREVRRALCALPAGIALREADPCGRHRQLDERGFRARNRPRARPWRRLGVFLRGRATRQPQQEIHFSVEENDRNLEEEAIAGDVPDEIEVALTVQVHPVHAKSGGGLVNYMQNVPTATRHLGEQAWPRVGSSKGLPRVTFVLESIGADLRPVHMRSEVTALVEIMARDEIHCSGLSFWRDLGYALAAPAKRGAARKAVGNF
ncbi:hypothetical protein ON010_g12914 [Phytophthora cinnamomi]|nr:hypothetical protein ON010_g12914 [Phytophthora cinnamomi]